MVVVVALLVVSTADKVQLAVGPFSLRPAQLIGLLVLAVAGYRGWLPAGPLRLALLGSAAAWCIALPSIVTFGIERASIPLQLAINLLLLAGTITIARRCSAEQLRRAITAGALLLAAIAVVLLVTTSPTESQLSSRLLGIPRPRGWFTEPTWLAILTAGLVAIVLQLRMYRAALLLTAGGLLLFTRTAVAAIAVAWLTVAVRRRALPASVVLIVLAVLWALAAWQLIGWLGATSFDGSSSLATRGSDIAATRAANGGTFLPFGGAELTIFDPIRDRTLPATSAVLPFDLLWKLGVGGLLTLALLAWVFLRGIPALCGQPLRTFATTPAGSFVVLALPITCLNNALGRPFLWVLLGLIAAAASVGTEPPPVVSATPRTADSPR